MAIPFITETKRKELDNENNLTCSALPAEYYTHKVELVADWEEEWGVEETSLGYVYYSSTSAELYDCTDRPDAVTWFNDVIANANKKCIIKCLETENGFYELDAQLGEDPILVGSEVDPTALMLTYSISNTGEYYYNGNVGHDPEWEFQFPRVKSDELVE